MKANDKFNSLSLSWTSEMPRTISFHITTVMILIEYKWAILSTSTISWQFMSKQLRAIELRWHNRELLYF